MANKKRIFELSNVFVDTLGRLAFSLEWREPIMEHFPLGLPFSGREANYHAIDGPRGVQTYWLSCIAICKVAGPSARSR